MKTFSAALVAALLIVSVTRSTQAQKSQGWQGVVLVQSVSQLNEGRLMQVLSAFAAAAGDQPSELLHARFSLDKQKALVEAAWFVKPTEAQIKTALVSIDSLMVVVIFNNVYDAKTYLSQNITAWETQR
jgi:hypothetical protein